MEDYLTCSRCATYVINGDESVWDYSNPTVEDERTQRDVVDATVETVGMVTLGDTVDAGVFDCYFCDEHHYGEAVLLHGESRP